MKKKMAGTHESAGPLMSDVARLAGVAVSTVSRALANPGRVNEETRLRIAAAAEELGYTPNAAARNLRVGRSDIVMVVLPGPLFYGASQAVSEVLQGVDAELTRAGFHLLIANLDREEATERHILDLAFGGTVRGAIILSSDLPRHGNRALPDAGIPIVSILLDLTGNGVPSVVTNEREAMRDATRRLIALGHRRFYFVPGPIGNFHDVERYGGLVEALNEAGLGEGSVRRFGRSYDFRQGFECGSDAAGEFLELDERPTAVLCCSDDIAIAFMHAIRGAGIPVPDAVSVVGFDGAAVGEFCGPGLATIRQPTADMGAAAARGLLKAITGAGSPAERTVIASEWLERGSTAPPPIPG